LGHLPALSFPVFFWSKFGINQGYSVLCQDPFPIFTLPPPFVRCRLKDSRGEESVAEYVSVPHSSRQLFLPYTRPKTNHLPRYLIEETSKDRWKNGSSSKSSGERGIGIFAASANRAVSYCVRLSLTFFCLMIPVYLSISPGEER